MTIADSPLLGQSASGLNFYDDSGRSTLADKKLLFRHFSLRQRDDDDAASLLNDDAQLCKNASACLHRCESVYKNFVMHLDVSAYKSRPTLFL